MATQSTGSDFIPRKFTTAKAGLINFRAGRDIKEVKQQRNKVIHSSAAHKNFTTHILSNRTQWTGVYINRVFMLLMRCVCVFWLCSASVSPGKNYWVQPAGVLSQLMFRCWDSQPPHTHNFVHAGVHTINVFSSLRSGRNRREATISLARRSQAPGDQWPTLCLNSPFGYEEEQIRGAEFTSPTKDCLSTAQQKPRPLCEFLLLLSFFKFEDFSTKKNQTKLLAGGFNC